MALKGDENMENKQEIDTSNLFLVGSVGMRTQIMMPPRGPLEKAEVLNLAAWLVAIVDPTGDEFREVLEAVCNT